MKKILLATVALLLSLSVSVHAKNMTTLGSFDVHHMVIGTSFLTPEIAKNYQITRSRYNALVNISVLDNSQPATPAKVVSISGTARNDLGQIKKLEFHQVKEGAAIYYLTQLKFSHEETFYFELTITDGQETQQLTFKQKLYVDE